jgi:type IV secretory pathway VirD2 relaxase
MDVRFLDGEWPPNTGQKKMLIAFAQDAAPGIDRGQMREVVRLAWRRDVETYAEAYEDYRGAGGELEPEDVPPPERQKPAAEVDRGIHMMHPGGS